MKGIKQMIKLRGGFQALNDPVLQQVFLVYVSQPGLALTSCLLTLNSTDFEIACCFERDLFLVDPMMANVMPIPVPPTYAEVLRSPLLPYAQTFGHDKTVLRISDETAEILDDVRFLTLSITSASDPGSARKIRTTAACQFPLFMCDMALLTISRATQTSIQF
jgi:hypothetical protein